MAPPSLWRELADGTAGPVVRVFVSLALAPLLAGLALFGSYVLAGWVSAWSRSYSGTYYGPDDDLVGCMLALACVAYVGGLAWIWTRNRQRMRGIWKASFLTASIIVGTFILGFLIDEMMRGGEEYLILSVVFLGAAAVILVWVQAARQLVRGVPLHNVEDGILDVRCPSCGYRMVGLQESRCPECGTTYTLDELLGRQDFLTRAHRRESQVPPVPVAGNGQD